MCIMLIILVSPVYRYSKQDRVDLMMLLVTSAEHYSILTTGHRCSAVLWDSPFLTAIARMSCSLQKSPRDDPVVAILFWTISERPKNVHSLYPPGWLKTLILFLCHILHSQIVSSAKNVKKHEITHGIFLLVLIGFLKIRQPDNVQVDNIASVRNAAKIGATLYNSKDKPALQAYYAFLHCIVKSTMEQNKVAIGLSEACLDIDIMAMSEFSELDNHKIYGVYTWLKHLLSELHASLSKLSAQHIELMLFMHKRNIALVFVRLIDFVQMSEIDNIRFRSLYRRSGNPMDITTLAENHDCLLLCEFQALIQSSIKLIHQKFPALRLDIHDWNKLVTKLIYQAPTHERNISRDAPATVKEHRSKINQNVLKAFGVLSPVASGEYSLFVIFDTLNFTYLPNLPCIITLLARSLDIHKSWEERRSINRRSPVLPALAVH